jgi:hypothetical protein
MREFMRQYSLAACCILAPLLFAAGAAKVTVDYLVPKDSSTKLTYKFYSSEAKQLESIPSAASANAAKPDEGSPTDRGKKPPANSKAKPDSTVSLVASQLQGRYGYSAATAFLFFVAVVTLVFASAVVIRQTRLSMFFLAVLFFGSLAIGIACKRSPYDLGRRLAVEDLLTKADSNEQMKPLKFQGWDTGNVAKNLVRVNSFIALFPVGMILAALCAISIRPRRSDIDLPNLKMRLDVIRIGLILSAVILVTAVLASKTLYEWPINLLIEEQRIALAPLGDSLTLLLGATGSIALFAAFLPAVAAFALDARYYRDVTIRKKRATKASRDDILEFAPLSSIAAVLAALSPLLASPVVGILKAILFVQN